MAFGVHLDNAGCSPHFRGLNSVTLPFEVVTGSRGEDLGVLGAVTHLSHQVTLQTVVELGSYPGPSSSGARLWSGFSYREP